MGLTAALSPAALQDSAIRPSAIDLRPDGADGPPLPPSMRPDVVLDECHMRGAGRCEAYQRSVWISRGM